jgi:hypothetical protein
MPNGRIILAALTALALYSTPAVAAPSTLDAYGGQAAVLGKPVHRTQASGSSNSHNPTTATSSVAPGGGQGPPAGPGAGGGGGTGGPKGSGRHGRHVAAPAASAALSTAFVPDQRVSGLQGPGSSLPFSWIDALVLAAAGLGLALVGLGVRRLARPTV